jgi:hypothetical protein
MDKRPTKREMPKPAAKPSLSREEAMARAAAETYAQMDAANSKPMAARRV